MYKQGEQKAHAWYWYVTC